MRGGIVWHLTVATLSFDDVLKGPTTAATLQRQGIVIRTSDNSTDLCDDGLSQLELNIICGVHHCLTGQGTGFTTSSWWPTDSNWQKNTQHTRWTEKSDRFFLGHLAKLQAGTQEPLNFDQWHTLICRSSSIQCINKFISSASQTFVMSHVGT